MSNKHNFEYIWHLDNDINTNGNTSKKPENVSLLLVKDKSVYNRVKDWLNKDYGVLIDLNNPNPYKLDGERDKFINWYMESRIQGNLKVLAKGKEYGPPLTDLNVNYYKYFYIKDDKAPYTLIVGYNKHSDKVGMRVVLGLPSNVNKYVEVKESGEGYYLFDVYEYEKNMITKLLRNQYTRMPIHTMMVLAMSNKETNYILTRLLMYLDASCDYKHGLAFEEKESNGNVVDFVDKLSKI